MKRCVAFFVFTVLCLLVLVACSNDDTPNVIESSSEEFSYLPDIEQFASGFSIKSKKYEYQGKNLAILDVTNETDKNYSLTVHGTYYDADGNIIKTETQTFEEFESGFRKQFLFRPNIVFESFDFDVETCEFEGECNASKFSMKIVSTEKVYRPDNSLMAQNIFDKFPTIQANVLMENRGSAELELGLQYFIVFDKNGEIHNIAQSGKTDFSPGMSGIKQVHLFNDTTGAEIEWPDPEIGEPNVICIVESIKVLG